MLLTVPDVAGLPESDAVAALEATGLVVGERVERPHRRIPAGTVIRTRPDAGETVDPGTPVEVVVSIGQPATPSPDADADPGGRRHRARRHVALPNLTLPRSSSPSASRSATGSSGRTNASAQAP